MVDISETKFKLLIGKSWSCWDLATNPQEEEVTKQRAVFKPKEPDKSSDERNVLPSMLRSLYGTIPDIEYFSVVICVACNTSLKTQVMANHYRRDSLNQMVCKRTDMAVANGGVSGMGIKPFYELRQASTDPFAQWWDEHADKDKQEREKDKERERKSDHKEKEREKEKSSHSSSKSAKKHSSSSSPIKHKSKKEKHYALSIPEVEQTSAAAIQSILDGKVEYEQLKFYADTSVSASDKNKKNASSSLDNFKIPLKNKTPDKLKSKTSSNTSSSCSNNNNNNTSNSNSVSHSSGGSKHELKSASSVSNSSSSGGSSNNSSITTATNSSANNSFRKPSLTIISEPPKMGMSLDLIDGPVLQKSKKKKKKKSKDEPRKVIPLKERAFNPDQHCGVIHVDGAPCTRSLTCKTHSIALRRAVPGRSAAFDTLLAAHKKARDEEKGLSKPGLSQDSDSNSNSASSQSSFIVSSTNKSSKTSNHVLAAATPPATVTSSPLQSRISSVSKPAPLPSRPVIIVEEKKEAVKGMSLQSLKRGPENVYNYLGSSIPPFKSFSRANATALAEFNPLDRLVKKSSKKRGFKDPLVQILPQGLSKTADEPNGYGIPYRPSQLDSAAKPPSPKKAKLVSCPGAMYESLLRSATPVARKSELDVEEAPISPGRNLSKDTVAVVKNAVQLLLDGTPAAELRIRVKGLLEGVSEEGQQYFWDCMRAGGYTKEIVDKNAFTYEELITGAFGSF